MTDCGSDNHNNHLSVAYNAILTRPAAFSWETSEYLKITSEGSQEFKTLIGAEVWSELEKLHPNVDKMTETFHQKLDRMIGKCFVWKKSRKKSNEKPWISDHIRKLEKKRLAIFREEGRSIRWKILDKAIKATINKRKEIYFSKETDRLKAIGRGAGWYSALNKLNDTNTQEWNIHQLEPDKTPETIANELAEHFSSITNQTRDTELPRIRSQNISKHLIPQLLESVVAKKIKECKKPNSVVAVSYTHLTLPTIYAV